MTMNLWLNLRRSLSNKSIPKRSSIKIPTGPIEAATFDEKDKNEIFKFPYGTKECVVYKEKGNNYMKEREGGNSICPCPKK